MVQMTSAELRSGCVGTFPVRRKKRHLDTDLVMHFHDDLLKEAIRKHREDFNNEMVTISKNTQNDLCYTECAHGEYAIPHTHNVDHSNRKFLP